VQTLAHAPGRSPWADGCRTGRTLPRPRPPRPSRNRPPMSWRAGPADPQSLIYHGAKIPGAPADPAWPRWRQLRALLRGIKGRARKATGTRWASARDDSVGRTWGQIGGRLDRFAHNSFVVVDVRVTGFADLRGDRITENRPWCSCAGTASAKTVVESLNPIRKRRRIPRPSRAGSQHHVFDGKGTPPRFGTRYATITPRRDRGGMCSWRTKRAASIGRFISMESKSATRRKGSRGRTI